MIEIIIHKTCPTSLKVVKFVREHNLSEKTVIIDAAERPYYAITKGVISVPAIFVNGKIIAMGPVDFDSLYERLTTGRVYVEDIDAKYGMKQTFIAILDALGTASWVYLKEDIKEILEYRLLVEPTIGIVDWEESRKEEYLKDVYDYFLSKKETFLKTYSKYFFKNFTKNFIREYYWRTGEFPSESVFDVYTEDVFGHWLATRGTIGRIGLRLEILQDPHKKELVHKAYVAVKESFPKIRDEVVKEQEWVLQTIAELGL
ncbi:MAG: glutaredoxin domain-containing protein [Candidatus Asgardarchaeia archaeon]